MRYATLFFAIIFCFSGYSQTSPLLQKIRTFQVEQDSFYRTGMFPSQIVKKKGRKTYEDNSIFFPALIFMTFETINDLHSAEEAALIDSMYDGLSPLFPYYLNRNGDITYNFYQTDPDIPFPNLKRFSKWDRAKLPDDLDNSSVLFLIQEKSDSINRVFKSKMAYQSELHPKVKSTFKTYRESEAYRTWFAKSMKQDLDICVMSNVLTYVFEKNLPLNKVDSASMDLITQMIKDQRHLTHPEIVSTAYPNTAIILYHVARVLSVSNDTGFNSLKEEIISEIRAQLTAEANTMEKVILYSSLIRLGESPEFRIESINISTEMTDFYWFRALFITDSNLWVRRLFGGLKALQLDYKCEAYYWTLLYELQKLSEAELEIHPDGRLEMTKG